MKLDKNFCKWYQTLDNQGIFGVQGYQWIKSDT